MSRTHRSAELRSIELHRQVAAHLVADPSVLDRARDRVEGWLAQGRPVSKRSALAWRNLLAHSPREVATALVRDDEEMRELRQSSPFAGTLTQQEREAALRAAG